MSKNSPFSVRGFLRSQITRLGYDVRRLRTIGADPFCDMKQLLAGEDRPMIFDVGANVGQSVTSFRGVFPEAAIHSFEPSPGTFQGLSEACRNMAGVSIWNIGLGAAPGKALLLENTNSDMTSFLEIGKDGWGSIRETTLVVLDTVDEFAHQHGIPFIHILKSDTQGYDIEVFKGAEGLMAGNKIALIFCEVTFSDMYKGAPPFDEMFRFLCDRNFLLVSFYEKFFQNDRLGWTDALFINREHHEKHCARKRV